MDIFKLIRKRKMDIKFFDNVEYTNAKIQMESLCHKWNNFTVPFLQDLGFLQTPEDRDKVMHLSRLEKEEAYNFLLDDFMSRNGRGVHAKKNFFKTVVEYRLGYFNKDDNSVTYVSDLDKLPTGVHSDLVILTSDDNLNVIATFNGEHLRQRFEYILNGDALEGYKRIEELCYIVQKIAGDEYFTLNNLIHLNEDGKWIMRNDIPLSTLVEAGKRK